jgi:RNA polymerase sigma-70 factor (ECF subfamily)
MNGMKSGDVEQLTRVAGDCAAALVLYARQWLDWASAHDVVQEALVALVSQREAPRNPVAWMYRAVRNRAIDSVRADQRRRRRERSIASMRGAWFVRDDDALLDGRVAEESLKRLGVELREVVVLRIWGDLTFAEIAEVMQLGVSTVHDRYKSALGQLRSALEKPCPTKTN